MRPLITKVITSRVEFEALKPGWNELLRLSGSDTVFLTFEWLRCWWKTVGVGIKLFVVIVKDGEQIVAIAPLVIFQYREVGVPVRRLQFIGSPYSDYADFIVVGDRDLCIRAILDRIMRHQREWDFVDLMHITDESPNWQHVQDALKDLGLHHTVSRWSICPYIELGYNFDEYMHSLPKNLRYDLRRGERELRKIGILHYEVLVDSIEAKDALAPFRKMLSRREKMAGRVGSPSAVEMFFRFLASLLEDDGASCFVHFSRLCLNGAAIAYHFGFAYGGKLYWYKPTFEPQHAIYSPGKLIIKYAIKNGVDSGAIEFDFLLGDEPYKFQWASCIRASYNIRFFRNDRKSQILQLWLNIVKPWLKQRPRIIDAVAHLRKRREDHSL